ncbi:MAG TPA: hypothetical protein VNZ57_12350 [Longimicrobiales bacterium]|nr:hypothetical protein [Longimicrobiales bacterium]
MDVLQVLLWGFAGTTVLTTMLRGSQALGLTRMDIPLLLGLMITPNRDLAKAYGFFAHLVNGWLFSLLYAAYFEELGFASIWIGGAMGAMHGLFVLAVGLPAIPGLHPRMATDARGPEPTRELEPPGFMALNYGRHTPIVTLLAHVVFGALLGAFYRS